MSRKLAVTSALSIMAMAMMVLFGTAPAREGAFAPQAQVTVSAPAVSGIVRILAGN